MSTTDLIRTSSPPATERPAGGIELQQWLLAGWLADYPETTRRAYLADWRDFCEFCAPLRIDPVFADELHVKAYKAQLEHHDAAKSTIARRLAALQGLFAYAVRREVIKQSPAKFVRRPKVSGDSQTLGLDWDEVSRLWQAAWRVGPREAALVGLLFFDGLRVSEACNATLEQIGTYSQHTILRVTRKGSKEHDVPLSPATQRAIAQLVSGRESGPIFMGNKGKPIARMTAWRIIKRLVRDAEIVDQNGKLKVISPHSLRHTFVTLGLEKRALHEIQDFAGHERIETTRRYDRARNNLDRHPVYELEEEIRRRLGE